MKSWMKAPLRWAASALFSILLVSLGIEAQQQQIFHLQPNSPEIPGLPKSDGVWGRIENLKRGLPITMKSSDPASVVVEQNKKEFLVTRALWDSQFVSTARKENCDSETPRFLSPVEGLANFLPGDQPFGTGRNLTSLHSNLSQPQRSPASDRDGPTAAKTALTSLNSITDQVVPSIAGQELVRDALETGARMRNAATRDAETIADAYRDVPAAKLPEYFQRASQELTKAANTLAEAKGGQLLPAERTRFRNLLLNAADKASAAEQAVREDLGPNRSLSSETKPPEQGANPIAKTASLADLFGQRLPVSDPTAVPNAREPASDKRPISAVSTDAQVDRLALFYGLPPGQREAIMSQLNLVENPSLTLRDGRKVQVPLLHNGYILGAGKTAVDCSSFVSALLDVDARKTRFTTLDFRSMWLYRMQGYMPRPPKYTPPRDEVVRQASLGFQAVDIYRGGTLLPGDLLLYSVPTEPIGHVFIIKDYQPTTMMAQVIEAAQSAGTIRERDFSLTLHPPDAPKRWVRPGLFVLRLKPDSNQACRYPASKKKEKRS